MTLRARAAPPICSCLAASYSVCRELAGADLFGRFTRSYVAVLAAGGALEFASFIEPIARANSLPYLSDVARLEAAYRRAACAANPEPLSTDVLAQVASCEWEGARVALHPSVAVVQSDFPVVSIWRSREAPPSDTGPEDALVRRHDGAPAVSRLAPGVAVFLKTLLRGRTFDVARATASHEPAFDVVAALAMIFSDKLLVSLDRGICTDGAERTS